MLGAILVGFLQVTAPQAAPEAAAVPQGQMQCTYDRAARVRNCTTSTGEEVRCRRQRELGTRFSTWVCLTAAEDQRIQDQTRQQLDRQQRVTTPGGA